MVWQVRLMTRVTFALQLHRCCSRASGKDANPADQHDRDAETAQVTCI